MGILRDKHPDIRTPDLADPKFSSFEDYAEYPDVAPLYISKEYFMWVAGKISG